MPHNLALAAGANHFQKESLIINDKEGHFYLKHPQAVPGVSKSNKYPLTADLAIMSRYSSIVGMVFMALFGVDTNAQSHLFPPRQSGTIVEAFLGTYDNRITSGLSIGHSINATLGLRLQGMWVNNNGRPGFKSIAPSVSYVFLKQEKSPLNLQVRGEYLYKRFTKIDTLSHHIGRFTLGAFRQISITQRIALTPLVQGGIDLARYTYDLTHESERLSVIGIQCPLIIRNLAVTPIWEHSIRTNTFLISIGWIFRSAERIDSFE